MFYYLVILGSLVYVFYWDLCLLELRIKYIVEITPLKISKIYHQTILKFEKSLLKLSDWIERTEKRLKEEIEKDKKSK